MQRRGSADSSIVERGLYIATTGMLSDITRQDVIAANLANVSTTGYKRDRVTNETFNDMLLSNLKNGRQVGGMNMGTRVASVVTDFSQGPLRNTGSPLDAALSGDGFFVVQTPQGNFFTRSGQFTMADDGTLQTADGNPVLGQDGKKIVLTDAHPKIASDGTITSGNTTVGRLAIVSLDVAKAEKVGANLWKGTAVNAYPTGTQVKQGFLEQSSVNAVTEMVEMIRTLRSYESAQKAIQSIDGTLEKAVNTVGVVGGG